MLDNNFNTVLSTLQAGEFIEAGQMLKQCHPNFIHDMTAIQQIIEAFAIKQYPEASPQFVEANRFEFAGEVCSKMRLNREAISLYSQTTPKTHEERAKLFYNLAVLCRRLNMNALGTHYLNKCAEFDPNYADHIIQKAYIEMAAGHWPQALEGHEQRWRYFDEKDMIGRAITSIPEGPNYLTHEVLRAMVNGESPKQDIIIYGEQGLGDHIMFLRYIQHLKQFGLQVHYMFHLSQATSFYHASHRLFNHYPSLAPIAQLGKVPMQTKYIAPLLSLPFLCQTRLSNGAGLNALPPPQPITIPKAVLTPIRQRLSNISGSVFACGHRGNSGSSTAPLRHIPLPLMLHRLREFLPDQKGAIIILQPELEPEEQQFIAEFQASYPKITVICPLKQESDLLDSVAWISLCDAVFSTDTALVHLAANQNCCPVYLWLYARGEWRWLVDHTSSPWYPNLTIHRQRHNESWESALNRFTLS